MHHIEYALVGCNGVQFFSLTYTTRVLGDLHGVFLGVAGHTPSSATEVLFPLQSLFQDNAPLQVRPQAAKTPRYCNRFFLLVFSLPSSLSSRRRCSRLLRCEYYVRCFHFNSSKILCCASHQQYAFAYFLRLIAASLEPTVCFLRLIKQIHGLEVTAW